MLSLNKKIAVLACVLVTLTSSKAFAQIEMYKLRNNKEIVSEHYRMSEVTDLYNKNRGKVHTIVSGFLKDLEKVLNKSQKEGGLCECNVALKLMQARGMDTTDPDQLREELVLVRAQDKIDDVLFQLLMRGAKFNKKLFALPNAMPSFSWFGSTGTKLLTDEEIVKGDRKHLLEAVKVLRKLPNEQKSGCAADNIISFKLHVQKFFDAKKQLDNHQLAFLNSAVKNKWITVHQYWFAKAFLSEEVQNWKGDLANFVEINQKVKNLYWDYVAERGEGKTKPSMTSVHIKRFTELNKRTKLYGKYTKDQVVLLAQVMKKASIRMGTDQFTEDSKAAIHHTYKDTRDGSKYEETYVLSPMEQFNWARRMLRKDMQELEQSGLFKYVSIDYEDIIAASLETGLVGMDEIQYLLTYDDLWTSTPETFWQKFKGYVMGFAGTASLFLPPPYNVITSLGLVFVQAKISDMKVDNTDKDHAYKVIN